KQVQAMDNQGYVYFGVVKSVQLTPNDDGSRQMTLKVDTGEGTVDVKLEDVFTILPAQVQTPPPVDPDDDGDDSGTDPVPGDETGETGETGDPGEPGDPGGSDETGETAN